MTNTTLKRIVEDYNYGKGMKNIEIAKKYCLSNATVRNVLIREGVYTPQRLPKRKNLNRLSAHDKDRLINKINKARILFSKMLISPSVQLTTYLKDEITSYLNSTRP